MGKENFPKKENRGLRDLDTGEEGFFIGNAVHRGLLCFLASQGYFKSESI